MKLDAQDWQRLSRLLDEVLDLPESEWAAWCDRQSGIAEPLRSVLKARLADEAANRNGLPELPEFSDTDLGIEQPQIGLAAGELVGPYRLIEEIGHGGMGAVWLAERWDGQLKRPVALKLPYVGLARGKLAERFARERDILATLVHAHIARLYDAGVSDRGVPYLAMEHVEGRPLTEYCREHALGLADRVRLFLQVVDAVQYAHGQLVIHRDLKPNNILVNAEGEVRLLDFGIAKLLDDDSALTQFEARPLTPQYAAPEQILGQPVGTAADIYGLGVLLYELLAEAPPYRLARDSRGALEQAILEADPRPPSSVAAKGRGWARALRGDLDTIVAKALAKAPADRYATAAALADDLRRHLAGEPVLARPASTGYRVRKFLRRHRLPVAAGVFALVALLVGLGVALWQTQVARKEAATATAVSEFMQSVFQASSAQQADPVKARATTARELLDIATGKIDTALDQAPEVRAQMFQVLGTIYAQLGLDDQSLALMAKHVAQTRLAYGEGSPQLLKSLLRLAIAERNVDIDRPGQRAALAEAGAIIDRASGIELDAKSVFWVLAAEYYGDNDFTKALTLVRQASAAAHEVWFDAEEGERPTALVGIARLQLAAGDCRQASANAGEAAEYLRRQQAQPACEGACYVQMGLALELGGLAAACLGQADAAGAALREALAASRKTFGDDDLATLRIEARLAAWLWTAGQHAEARTMLEGIARALEGHTAQDRSKQHFNVLAAAATAMNVLKNHGHALRLADRALALRDPAIDASPFVAAVLRDKARALAGLQRYGEAAEVLARAKAMREKAGIRPAAALQEEAAITALLPV